MTAWRDRISDLLFDGERVVESVDADPDRAVVTTHRVLAFAPDRDPRFRQVDRPNVTGVGVETAGETRWLRRAAKAGAWGGALVIGGALVNVDALLADVSVPDAAGVAGVLSLARTLFALLSLVDDAMVALGAVALGCAVACAGLYVRSRERELVVSVSGDDDVRLAPDADAAAVLDRAVKPRYDGTADGEAADDDRAAAVEQLSIERE